MNDSGKKKRVVTAAVVLIVAAALSAWADGPLAPKPTPYIMDLYGEIAGAVPGDVMTVQDPQGTLCGSFTVVRQGRYGFLHVYGDDRATPVREGALAGEPLEFRLNGAVLTPLAPGPVLWRVDGREQVDFRR